MNQEEERQDRPYLSFTSYLSFTFVDWTRRLLSDGRERLLSSGIGLELICKRYAPPRSR